MSRFREELDRIEQLRERTASDSSLSSVEKAEVLDKLKAEHKSLADETLRNVRTLLTPAALERLDKHIKEEVKRFSPGQYNGYCNGTSNTKLFSLSVSPADSNCIISSSVSCTALPSGTVSLRGEPTCTVPFSSQTSGNVSFFAGNTPPDPPGRTVGGIRTTINFRLKGSPVTYTGKNIPVVCQ